MRRQFRWTLRTLLETELFLCGGCEHPDDEEKAVRAQFRNTLARFEKQYQIATTPET